MKRILSNIIFSIVICVSGYLLIANILHIIYLNRYETFNFDIKPMTDVKEKISNFEKNVEKVASLDNSVFTDEDLEFIKNQMNATLENIKNQELLKYKGTNKLYFKDLIKIDLMYQLHISGNITLLETLAKYDSSITNYIEVYKHDFISSAYSGNATFIEPFLSYRYNTLDFFSSNIIEPSNARILSRVHNLGYYVVKANYFTTLILKIGDGENE